MTIVPGSPLDIRLDELNELSTWAHSKFSEEDKDMWREIAMYVAKRCVTLLDGMPEETKKTCRQRVRYITGPLENY